jgi:hypothetical protein
MDRGGIVSGYDFEITFSGLNELMYALSQFGDMVADEIVEALDEVGARVKTEAQENIIAQGLVDTGAGVAGVWYKCGIPLEKDATWKKGNPWLLVANSKETYYMSMYETAKGVFGYGKINFDLGAGSSYSLMAGLDMNAAMTEYGTSKRRARPWLRPAFDTMVSYGYMQIEKAIISACNNASRLNRTGVI